MALEELLRNLRVGGTGCGPICPPDDDEHPPPVVELPPLPIPVAASGDGAPLAPIPVQAVAGSSGDDVRRSRPGTNTEDVMICCWSLVTLTVGRWLSVNVFLSVIRWYVWHDVENMLGLVRSWIVVGAALEGTGGSLWLWVWLVFI